MTSERPGLVKATLEQAKADLLDRGEHTFEELERKRVAEDLVAVRAKQPSSDREPRSLSSVVHDLGGWLP